MHCSMSASKWPFSSPSPRQLRANMFPHSPLPSLVRKHGPLRSNWLFRSAQRRWLWIFAFANEVVPAHSRYERKNGIVKKSPLNGKNVASALTKRQEWLVRAAADLSRVLINSLLTTAGANRTLNTPCVSLREIKKYPQIPDKFLPDTLKGILKSAPPFSLSPCDNS